MSWLSIAWKAGPWIVAALALGFGLYERSAYFEESSARAADLAAAQQSARAAAIADATHTREIEDAHAAEVAYLKDQANARELSIAQAPAAAVCAGSPAMRALFDGLRARNGLRARIGAAGAGQPRGAGGAGAAVSR